MIRFRWMTAVALLAVLATGTSVLAQGPGGRRGDRFGGGPFFGGPRDGVGLGILGRDLDLSDAQRQQIRAIMTKARTDSRPVVDRLQQAIDARRKAMALTPVDENQIRSTTQALVAAQTDVAIARARVQSDIFALLTPEQQTKVKQQQERRQARLETRRDRRRGRS